MSKQKELQIIYPLIVVLLRCLADSNRRRRFCRPLTKPLIQGTVFKFDCKGMIFYSIRQILSVFFLFLFCHSDIYSCFSSCMLRQSGIRHTSCWLCLRFWLSVQPILLRLPPQRLLLCILLFPVSWFSVGWKNGRNAVVHAFLPFLYFVSVDA